MPRAADRSQLYFDTTSDAWRCDRKVAGRPLWGALFIIGFLSSSDTRAATLTDNEEEPNEDVEEEDRWGLDDEMQGDAAGRQPTREELQEEEVELEQEQELEEQEAHDDAAADVPLGPTAERDMQQEEAEAAALTTAVLAAPAV